jgi:hypothetical protein
MERQVQDMFVDRTAVGLRCTQDSCLRSSCSRHTSSCSIAKAPPPSQPADAGPSYLQDFNWNPFRLIAVPACEGLPAPVALPQVSAAAAAAAGFSMRYNGSGLAPFTGLDTALDPRSNRARSSTVCQVTAAASQAVERRHQ